MNTSKIRPIYYPLTVPHPERLRKWSCKIDYRSAEVIAAGEVSATRYRLPAPAPGAAGKRLAFVSDFHYRGHPKDRKLADLAVERIRAFSPDFLCFGGDLTSDAAELDTQPELLEKFRDCAPVRFAVPGNWERGKSWLPVSFWEELYAEAGIRFLCNAGAEADCFYFHGADDLAGGDPRLPESWPEERAPILLAHRPDTVIALDTCHALDPIALILCPHARRTGPLPVPRAGLRIEPIRLQARLRAVRAARRNAPHDRQLRRRQPFSELPFQLPPRSRAGRICLNRTHFS